MATSLIKTGRLFSLEKHDDLTCKELEEEQEEEHLICILYRVLPSRDEFKPMEMSLCRRQYIDYACRL